MAALLDLPFCEIPIETEEHALLYCPEYDNVRECAPISLLNDLKQDVAMVTLSMTLLWYSIMQNPRTSLHHF